MKQMSNWKNEKMDKGTSKCMDSNNWVKSWANKLMIDWIDED